LPGPREKPGFPTRASGIYSGAKADRPPVMWDKSLADDTMSTPDAEQLALAKLIVESLNLQVSPGEIDPDAPLFGEGLGLDSIDMLEIALAVSQTYGVKLRSDEKDNPRIFRSLASLNRHIQQNRT
jgi:acyl carrier protein